MHMRPASPKHRAPRSGGTARQRGRHVSDYGDGFGRFAVLATLALLPGAGLVATGRRRLGALLLLVAGVGLAVLAAAALTGDVIQRALAVAVSRGRLLAIAAVIVVVGVVWCATILITAWRARPHRPTPFQAVVGLVLVGALCSTVALPSAKGAQLALVQRDLVGSLFDGSTHSAKGAANPNSRARNPWKGIPRVNLLLLGSDSGSDRTGVRTDSMMVVSIDTKTGNATLIGLPRNLQNVPFPESNPLHQLWPNGFDCGSECLLNAVWTQAVQHKDLFPGDPNPGLTTTRDAISEVTGLSIDNVVTIDIAGFRELVDAMGGVVVNVHQRLPIGGGKISASDPRPRPITGWIEPGRQRLFGERAMWFARSRSSTDDYDRMRRQRCLVGDLVNQVNPVRVLNRYAQLADVLKNNLTTDIQQDDLQAWVVLADRMKKARINSLPLTNKVINSANPDFEAIRSYVADALAPKRASSKSKSSKTTASTPAPTTPAPTTPAATTQKPGATDSKEAQNLSDVC